ncbi:glycoside hydrolase/deacetylase [Neocallimastix californiae]|uniref:Glycoside hydrolase/deacetylase n=1 Tax=Neocallimastix californiae TaxID=1754190 RepID=A0A1Y2FMF8_9FUNG|nr:glycoside hydrolase/deacetylase [Neocallimastix californiae]|eukprot:ORY85163.1 glycoside hydrolase/deacetylase [Neocallimastix californiae]
MLFLKSITLALSSVIVVSASRISSCTEPNTIALTFDDGPFQYTTDLLDELRDANIHATFFINGYNYWHDLETDPEKLAILTRAVNEGHQIASHTWKHEIPEDQDEVKPMMDKLDDLIEKATGDCKDDCIAYFEELGYNVIYWDTDTNDWDYKEIGAPARVKLVKEFLTEEFEQKRDNYLVLMHDVNDHTVHQIVPWIIENAPSKQYKFVTVAECLGDTKETHYDPDGNLIPRQSAFNATETDIPSRGIPADNSTSFNLKKTDANSGASNYFLSSFVISTFLLAYSLTILF